jgi:hypothetical protein
MNRSASCIPEDVFFVHLVGANDGRLRDRGPAAGQTPHRPWLCGLVAWMLVHDLAALSPPPVLEAAEYSVFQWFGVTGRTCRNKVEIGAVL